MALTASCSPGIAPRLTSSIVIPVGSRSSSGRTMPTFLRPEPESSAPACPKKTPRPKAETPKGFRDYFGAEVTERQEMLAEIARIYRLYGFEALESSGVETVEALGKFLPDVDRPNEGVFAWQEDAEADRPGDWLWVGAQYREFASWRERYPGGLSKVEEAFAVAMTNHGKRRRRRRRVAANLAHQAVGRKPL